MTARGPAAELAWLREVGALRKVEATDAGFIVELPSRQLLELDAASVPAFKAGVLAGWRLPRSEARLG
jgi:hypothetical protein